MMTPEPLPAKPADTGSVDAESPWPGLASFREADQEFFHGRDAEAEDLLRLVLRDRLTVLFGLSGLGKTSLLQAGLFPRLRQENVFPVSIRLDFSGSRLPLVEQVRDAIRRDAVAAGVEAPEPRPGESLWESFHRQGMDFWSARNRLVTPILVFDQFEEIFTHGRRDPNVARETDAFLDEIASLCEGSPPPAVRLQLDKDPSAARAFSFNRHPYKVLLSLREDFLPDLEGLRGRIRSIVLNRFRLCRMNGANARGVVTGAGGHLIDLETAERVVRFVAGRREEEKTPLAGLEVEPALLSVVCRELNNKRRAQDAPRITADLLQGNRDEILTGFYERSLESLDPRVRTFIEERLLTTSGFRNSVALEDALAISGVTRAAVDQLVDGRLLRIEDRGGVERIELTHDVLTGVIRASRDRRRELEAREQAEAERLQAEERERRARQRLKRERLVLAVVTLLLLVAASGAWMGIRGERRARAASELLTRTRAEADVKVAAGLEERSPSQALAYLARALRSDPANVAARTWATDLLLHRTWPLPVLEVRDPQGFFSADFSPDGQRLVTATASGTAQVWDARTGQPLGPPLRHPQEVFVARFSPDGTRIVTVGDQSMAWIWDARTSEVIARLPGEGNNILFSVDFSPDGSTMVIPDGHKVRFWDTRTGRARAVSPLELEEDFITIALARFTSDGRHLLTAETGTGTILLWDLATRKPIRRLSVPPGLFYGMSLHRDGNLLALALEQQGRLLDLRSGTLKEQALRHQAAISSIDFSPDGRQIATASEDRTARVWDATTGLPLTEPLRHEEPLRSVRFSLDGRRILTASNDGTARLWDIQTGQARPELLPIQGPEAISPEANRLALLQDGQVHVLDLPSGRPAGPPIVPGGFADKLLLDTGGRVLAILVKAKLRLWDVATGRAIGPAMNCEQFVFNEGGHRIATVWRSETTVRDPRTGRILAGPFPQKSWLIDLSPQGDRVLTGPSLTTIQIRSVEAGAPIGEALRHEEEITAARFSPDGRLVVTASANGVARIWDAQSGAPIGSPLQLNEELGGGPVLAVFGSSSRFVLLEGNNKLSVFDLESGKPLATPSSSGLSYRGMSRNGEVVVTVLSSPADETGSIQVWRLRTGELVAKPFSVKGYIFGGSLRPDGRIFYSINDGRLNAWQLAAGSSEDAALLATLAELAGGLRLDEQGTPTPVEGWPARIAAFRRQIPASNDPLSAASLARWFLADRSTRPPSPLATALRKPAP